MALPRIAVGGALVLLAVLLAATALQSHLLLDEGAYHLATRDLARGHGLFIANGYEDFASLELTFVVPGYSAQVAPHGGRLVSQYPYLYPLLATPLYALVGYRALIWINCAAFALTIALVGMLAARLGADRRLAWVSAAIYALCTFAGDYAQSAMPHALSTALCTGGVLAAWRTQSAAWPRAGLLWGGAAGLLLGAAFAARLDSVLVIPAALIAAFSRERRGPALAMVAGLLPPLLLVALSNRARFGSWSPVSYGVSAPAAQYVAKTSGIGYYAPALALAALLFCAAALAWKFRHRRAWSWSIAAVALVAVAAVPSLRAIALRELNGAYQLGIDLRAIPVDPGLPAAESSSRAISYLGALKKAWIQSCPYLPLLVLAVGAVRAGQLARHAALVLAITPAVFLAFYAWGAWHGGLGLNLRYFSPALPFVAILAAVAFRYLEQREPVRNAIYLGAGAAFAVAIFWRLGGSFSLQPLASQESFALDLPLVVAAAIAFSAALYLAAPRRLYAEAAAAAGAFGCVWAAVLTLAYDVPATRATRAVHAAVAEYSRAHVPPRSVLVVWRPDELFGLADVPGVIFATPRLDDFRDLPALLRAHLSRGYTVVGVMPQIDWNNIESRGAFRGLELIKRGEFRHHVVKTITPREPTQGP